MSNTACLLTFFLIQNNKGLCKYWVHLNSIYINLIHPKKNNSNYSKYLNENILLILKNHIVFYFNFGRFLFKLKKIYNTVYFFFSIQNSWFKQHDLSNCKLYVCLKLISRNSIAFTSLQIAKSHCDIRVTWLRRHNALVVIID